MKTRGARFLARDRGANLREQPAPVAIRKRMEKPYEKLNADVARIIIQRGDSGLMREWADRVIGKA